MDRVSDVSRRKNEDETDSGARVAFGGGEAAAEFTTSAALQMTETLLRSNDRGEVGEGRLTVAERNVSPPKKRAVLLTAFIVCISFLIFISNLLSSLISEFLDNDRVWNHLRIWMNATMPTCATINKDAL